MQKKYLIFFSYIIYATNCYGMANKNFLPHNQKTQMLPLIQQLRAREYGTTFRQDTCTFFNIGYQTIIRTKVKLQEKDGTINVFPDASALTLSHDERYLVAGLDLCSRTRCRLVVIDPTNFKIMRTYQLASSVRCITPLATHKNIIFCNDDSIWEHDMHSSAPLQKINLERIPKITPLAMLNESTIVLVSSQSPNIIILLDTAINKYTFRALGNQIQIYDINAIRHNELIISTTNHGTFSLQLDENYNAISPTEINLTTNFCDITFNHCFFACIDTNSNIIIAERNNVQKTTSLNLHNHLIADEQIVDDPTSHINFLNYRLIAYPFKAKKTSIQNEEFYLALIDAYTKKTTIINTKYMLTNITLLNPRTIIGIEDGEFITFEVQKE